MISLTLIHENFPVAPIGGPAQQQVIANKLEKPQSNAMQQVAEKYTQMVQPISYPQQFSPYIYPQQSPMVGYGSAFAAPAIASIQQQNDIKKVQKSTQPKDVEITTSEFLKKKLDKKRQLAKKKLNNTMEFLKPFGLGAATALTAQALKQQYDNFQQGV